MKRNAVQSLVNKTLTTKIEVEETLGMDNPYHYRNKAQYPVGLDKEGKPLIGVFANRTHEIIPIENCLIQNEQTEKIAKYFIQLYCIRKYILTICLTKLTDSYIIKLKFETRCENYVS